MNITIMAHDKKKELMVQFCTAYKSVLAKHSLSATATTGRLVAEATAQGLREIAEAAQAEGGTSAINLRLAEQYIAEFGKIAKAGNTMVLPTDMANIAGFLKAAQAVVKEVK